VISGTALTSVSVVSYVDPTFTATLPTYTQVPNCAYTLVYEIQTTSGGSGSMPAFMTVDQSPGAYSVFTTVIADAGAYNLMLVVSLDGYPPSYAAREDSSVAWTVNIVDPCVTSTLAALQALITMTTSVMFGSAVTQAFT
jgi:hypothetical protein